MGYKAQWGPMGFIVSPTKIVPFDSMTTTIAVKSDSGNDTSGKSTTNNRGLELQSIQFSTKYLKAAGVDPRERFEEWTSLVGSANPLYIGEQRFGPAQMLLKSVAISESILSTEGVFLSITLTITLEEVAGTGTTKKSSTKSTKSSGSSSSKKAAETYAKTVEKKKAMKATASEADRKRTAKAVSKELNNI